jgi:hypothetical protein
MFSVPVSFQSGFVGRFLSRIVIGFVVATLLAIFLVARADDAAATRYVIYQNSDASPPDRLIGQPYSHVILSFLTVQYYNNPEFDAPFASRIVGAQTAPLPWSYAGPVTAAGGLAWPSEKTVIGLPVYRADAANGHLPPKQAGAEIVCPLRKRFGHAFGGLTGWQFSTLTRDHRFWNAHLGDALSGVSCAD